MSKGTKRGCQELIILVFVLEIGNKKAGSAHEIIIAIISEARKVIGFTYYCSAWGRLVRKRLHESVPQFMYVVQNFKKTIFQKVSVNPLSF